MAATDTSNYFDPMCAPFTHDVDGTDGVVLIHGWTGTPAHFRMLGDELATAGFAVDAPLLPGHGTRVEELASARWNDWVREVVLAAGRVAARGKRVHFVGLSMGGDLSLLAAPVVGAASVTVINPAIRTRSRTMWFSPLFRGSSRVLEREPRIPPDPGALAFFQQYDGNPIGAAADLRDLMRAARKHLSAVTCPALVVQSRADETVKPISGLIVYEGISSVDKRIVWLQRSRHNSLIDVERDVIHREVIRRIRTS